jgi:hypothetical protein
MFVHPECPCTRAGLAELAVIARSSDNASIQRYTGGITGSRGHEGDNVGRQTVERIVAGSTDLDRAHAVFGCALGVEP